MGELTCVTDDRRRPFMPPYGTPPDVAYRMQRASDAFRSADNDYSGNLDLNEFQRALAMLGQWTNPQDMVNIFYMIDQDRSGRVNEREFVEVRLPSSDRSVLTDTAVLGLPRLVSSQGSTFLAQ
jgi:hypothetical protein